MVETRSQTSRSHNQQRQQQQQSSAQTERENNGDDGVVGERSDVGLDPPPPVTIWSEFLGILTRSLDWFGNTPTCKSIGVGLVVLILALVVGWMVGWEESRTREWSVVSFEEEYRSMMGRFPSQSEETRESLYIAMKHILGPKEPRDPSSMIVLIPPSLTSSTFPSCFIGVVGGILNRVSHSQSPLPVKVMNESTFRGREVERVQLELRDYFQSGGTSVLVSQIQDFPSEDHLSLFHTFCDSTHAPVKRAAYFFLLPIPSSLYNPNGWEEEMTGLGNSILETAWSNVLSWDKIHPLLARIGSWGTIQLNHGDHCDPEWGKI